MPRQKRERFEYVAALGRYRKRIRDVDGKYTAIYAKTEAELAEKVRQARAAVEQGAAALASPTVAQYAERWLALAVPGMSMKYRESMEQAVRLHIVPIIGAKRLEDVQPNDCLGVLNALDGMSASLQSKTLSAMSRIFESAVENRLCSKNPAKNLKAGGEKAKEKVPLTAEQKKALLEAVKGTRAEPFVMLGLYTGMRREELLGLTWGNVKLDTAYPSVVVCRKVLWEHNRPVVVDGSKTPAGQREIPIAAPLVRYLTELRDGLPEEQRKPESYVIGGEPLTQSQFRNLWRIIERRQTGEGSYNETGEDGHLIKRTFRREKGAKSRGGDFCYTLDFEVTPHILRHTYITDLILSGANIRKVQYLAGHSNIKTTLNIYTHLVEHAPENLMDEVKKAFPDEFPTLDSDVVSG